MAETREDLPRVLFPGGIRLALNVRMTGIRPELVVGLLIISELCIARGLIVTITSILNGEHMKNSLHYTGAALDFVIPTVSGRSEWVAELRERLGFQFDVIDEGDHIHIEYQPHSAAIT